MKDAENSGETRNENLEKCFPAEAEQLQEEVKGKGMQHFLLAIDQKFHWCMLSYASIYLFIYSFRFSETGFHYSTGLAQNDFNDCY